MTEPKGKWRLPETPEELDIAMERIRVATVALREIIAWMEREGADPPECVLARAKALNMTPEEYYQHFEAIRRRDWMDETEKDAMVDWAINQVQPNWRRNPNPDYPSLRRLKGDSETELDT